MGQITVPTGSPLPLIAVLSDGATNKFPQAIVYNSSNVVVATKYLTSIANGIYKDSTYTPPSNGDYLALYIVYDDSGHTIENTTYPRVSDEFSVGPVASSSVSVGAQIELEVQLPQDTDVEMMQTQLVDFAVVNPNEEIA